MIDRLLAVAALRRGVGAAVARRRALRRRRLPIARSEGRGHNPYPNAYLYRDWVIKAFNDDMRYDQFVKAQLAGDLLTAGSAEGAGSAGNSVESTRARTLPALGFLGLGPWFYDNGAGRDHARRRASRSRRRRVARLPRADGRLRALPRPQIRSDPDRGLLLARRCLLQHRLHEIPARAEEGRRRLQGAGQEDREQGEAARGLLEDRIDEQLPQSLGAAGGEAT